jgi:hypothetical protein
VRVKALPKMKPITEEIRAGAIATIAAAWRSVSPVVSFQPENQAAIADKLLRRYRSLERRGVAADDWPGQVRDLARGRVEASVEEPSMVGRLMQDYEWLAEQFLRAIAGAENSADK